ncbi:MAG: HPr(Ser) kinase/phosphatase [Fusobacteria bacterium]|nr:HPr(Ser) kinase/phosphatase [Fusobacteriota bacterium]
MEKLITVEQLVKDLKLRVLCGKDNLLKTNITADIYRPGIELTGYLLENNQNLDKYIHVIGKEEVKYFYSLPEDIRKENFIRYFSYSFPCLIVVDNKNLKKDFIEIAKIENKILLQVKGTIQSFLTILRIYLQKELAPEIILNNFTLLDIFGIGLMITGDESAKIGSTIELLEKGHRFITDELLVIKKISDTQLIGENGYHQNQKNKRYILKVFNDEKIDVVEYFGIGSSRRNKEIDLIIKFEKWDSNKTYDRLGVDITNQYLLGINIPKLVIPVRKGRNLGIILETAAINERLKKSGENSALTFINETQKMITINRKKREKIEEGKMSNNKIINARTIKEKFDLKILYGESLLDEKNLTTPYIHRPSLEFSGFYEILEEGGYKNLQLIGQSELNYLNKLLDQKRDRYLEHYFSYDFPFLLITGAKNVPDYIIKNVKEKNHLLMCTEQDINEVSEELIDYFEKEFAEEITMHGVLVEVFGFGVMLIGKSGIGKSETALELIHRGHRLIADDKVRFVKYNDGRVIGSGHKSLYFMEIRGIGIIDIKTLYGLGSVRHEKQLDVVIELKELKVEDYLTKKEEPKEEIEILGKKFPKIELYISSGRNASSMVEVSTMNLRAKFLGYENEKRTENMDKKDNFFSNIGNIITGRKK